MKPIFPESSGYVFRQTVHTFGSTDYAFRQPAAQIQVQINRGLALHQQGQLAAADEIYRQVLQLQPQHFDALHLLGVIALQTGNALAAFDLISKATDIQPNSATAHNNCGNALRALGRLNESLARYDKAIAAQADYTEAHYNRGNVLFDLGQFDTALVSYRSALSLNPDYALAHFNYGLTLAAVGQFEAAITAYDRAISLKPDFAEAYNSRGTALASLARYDAAIANYDRALALAPDDAGAYFNRGVAFAALNQHKAAIDSYKHAIAVRPTFAEAFYQSGLSFWSLKQLDIALDNFEQAVTAKPDYTEAFFKRGQLLAELARYADAISSHRQALSVSPDVPTIHFELGNMYWVSGQYETAIASYNRAVDLDANLASAYFNRGMAQESLKQFDAALSSYDRALTLEPDFDFLFGVRLFTARRICDWRNHDAQVAELEARISRNEKVSPSFGVLAISSSPSLQRRAAEIWAGAKDPAVREAPRAINKTTAVRRPAKLRVGYYSADYHNHATAYLMAELFERHDRERFEIVGFSLGADQQDEMRQRLQLAFDKFIDVRLYNDHGVAELSRQLEVDIAIDLKGYTQDSRPGIFAARAAPLQVSYIGYPGTMGVEYIDYLIADKTVVPEGSRLHYSEKIAYLPHCYQVNDSTRQISTRVFTRQELGLPENGFVFCCFNNNYKITPSYFDIWMRLLHHTPASVLWLLQDTPSAALNLRREAEARGIDPTRLVFADCLPQDEHLARHRFADLFLDTAPYNAHTTASDALWAGLPVLTCPGETFASRVATSLLRTIGLHELVARDLQCYETLALELSRRSVQLKQLREKLAKNRRTSPLFDAGRLTRHLEQAYVHMHQRRLEGLPPEHFSL